MALLDKCVDGGGSAAASFLELGEFFIEIQEVFISGFAE